MSRSVFAVCDEDEEFVYNFLDYFMSKNIDNVEICGFTESVEIQNYLSGFYVDLLLISNSMAKDISRENVGQVVILSDGEISMEYKNESIIFKYQSAEKIIREMLTVSANVIKENKTAFYKPRRELLGVYSPVKRCGKTSFAITMGHILANKKKVLYLNLEEYSGMAEILKHNGQGDVLDLVYFERQKKGNSILKMQAIVNTLMGMDYVAPARFSEELKNISKEEWLSLIDTIMHQGGYETVIIDLGEGIRGIVELLEKCDEVYMPILEDDIAQKKIKSFKEYLIGSGNSELLTKLKDVYLPPLDSDSYRVLEYGRIEDIEYIRQVEEILRN